MSLLSMPVLCSSPIASLPASCLLIAISLGAPQEAAQEAAQELPRVVVPDGERVTMEPRLEDLAFLAGEWTGTDGTSTWKSWYSTPEGGQVLGASKELRGGRVVMIDFEQFFLDGGKLRMTPYPFGNRSVTFTLSDFSLADKRAVFANPEHDFPQQFTYHRTAEDTLLIELEGDMGSGPVKLVIELHTKTRAR